MLNYEWEEKIINRESREITRKKRMKTEEEDFFIMLK